MSALVFIDRKSAHLPASSCSHLHKQAEKVDGLKEKLANVSFRSATGKARHVADLEAQLAEAAEQVSHLRGVSHN
jgi:hypothetical protein